jgi:hypothetical protein
LETHVDAAALLCISVQLASLPPRFAQSTAHFRQFLLEKAANCCACQAARSARCMRLLLLAASATSAVGDVVQPVPLRSVVLLPGVDDSHGVFARHAHNLQYLAALDPDRLACPFLTTAGLNESNQSSAPCVDYTENRGHWFQGHYLSATAHMVATTRNATVARRAERLVTLLERCQRADGFLGAWPSGVFDDLEAGRCGKRVF